MFEPTNVAAQVASGPDLLAYLFANGHFNQKDHGNLTTQQTTWHEVRDLDMNDPKVVAAIISWQSFRPTLSQTGVFDRECEMRIHAEAQYRCGLPDVINRESLIMAWPAECKHDITTTYQLSRLNYSGQTGQSISDAWLHGLELWNLAGDLTLKVSPLTTRARVTAGTQSLGRYILAWSELANGLCSSLLEQAYNSDIDWRWHLLWTTICHEIGHAIGIGHGGQGIMQPAHDPSVNGLDTWDIAELVHRYGRSTPTPPVPPPGPSTFDHAEIQLFDADHRPIAMWYLTQKPTC